MIVIFLVEDGDIVFTFNLFVALYLIFKKYEKNNLVLKVCLRVICLRIYLDEL